MQICEFWLAEKKKKFFFIFTCDAMNGTIRITYVNSTNQVSDVCRRTTSKSDNNNPHNNVNNKISRKFGH